MLHSPVCLSLYEPPPPPSFFLFLLRLDTPLFSLDLSLLSSRVSDVTLGGSTGHTTTLSYVAYDLAKADTLGYRPTALGITYRRRKTRPGTSRAT